MVTMGFGGEVSGVDVCTIAFDETQLAITANVIVPGTLERVQQLLLGPFKGADAASAPPRLREWPTSPLRYWALF
jgi:hypothetical protein